MFWKTSSTVALCSAANFINAADRVIMPIAIIQMTDEFKWDLHGQGWVLSSFAIGYMSSQVIGGSAAKKYGGKYMLALAVFMWSLSTLLTPLFAHSFYALFLSRVVLGIGEGIGLPTVFHIFAHTIHQDERSRAFGYLVALGSIGQTIAAIVCPHLPWRYMFYLFGSLGFVWVALWLVLYKEMRGPDEEEFVDPPKVTSSNVMWTEFISHWPLWSLYIAHFSMNWANYIIMQWLPTYMTRTLGAASSDIMYTAVPYIMNSIVGVAAGHFADSLIAKKWTILSVRRLMTCLGLLGPGLFLLLFSAVYNVPLAIIFISISMSLSACNSSGHLSNHAEVAPNHAGITFAISNTLATIPGILCGPLTAELVTQSHGRWFPVFILAALINFVGAIIYQSQSSSSQVI
ncbi:probable anion transporter 4, chloroplastic [Lingula anatina]|uniref:Probable anion transporter 4, chloroplastic n=1 Tax=Lingula anatina TaxID=7574 RepID=A0A1S3I2B2_LINAN|nr:probable anion transporter 4, chloroplastic [Lingula anatina]|eukprot:XP_013391484.1 probable anion transporter 4, chloroplastic [Lingula anatina]